MVKSGKMNPGRQVLAGGLAEARGGHFFADADDPWGALSLVAAVEWAATGPQCFVLNPAGSEMLQKGVLPELADSESLHESGPKHGK